MQPFYMQPYQERVAEEQQQLAAKILKLKAFTTDRAFDAIDRDEALRLLLQLHHMEAYDDVLRKRINAF